MDPFLNVILLIRLQATTHEAHEAVMSQVTHRRVRGCNAGIGITMLLTLYHVGQFMLSGRLYHNKIKIIMNNLASIC